MKKGLTIFLQVIVLLLGAAILFFLLYMPTIEGVNANATHISQIYFDDPFLAYVYVGSIAFFVGVYKVFKVLGYAGQNQFYSQAVVKALRAIKYCALVVIAFTLGGQAFIMTTISDDRAGGIMMGNLIIFGSIVTAVVASILARKAQNNLTV